MGCCATNREGKNIAPTSDSYSAKETEMKLSMITIMQFQKILKDAAGDRTITIPQLGEAFKDFHFGKMLLQDGDNLAKQLVNHSIFKNRAGQIDWYRLFTLGLLYAKGTFAEKAEVLVLTYDSNNDGDLFTRSVTIFLNSLVQIAGVIVPAILEGRDAEELDESTEERVNNLVHYAKEMIFGEEIKVMTSHLKRIMIQDLNYFFTPIELRAKLAIKKTENPEALQGN